LLTTSGVDIDGPDAISKHYNLLAAVMRIICAALLSRGIQNEQSLDQGRRFLAENRLSILAVLKRSAGLGTGAEISEESIDELAESFMLLISVSGFLDVSSIPVSVQLLLTLKSSRTRRTTSSH
jgi:nuclear pore complex protein Nup205